MEKPKGTVTSLSSLFPAEEAQNASQRVHDTISQRQKELDQLRDFINDNTNLINTVQKLPEELYHDIMVPFGKAAFFPGRLIHTNEFLVLRGEGYYAENTSKQTTEILKRRGKALESQVQSLKAVMQDLRVEASFFNATASESAEGVVEIREEYIEEPSAEKVSMTGLRIQDPHNFSKAEKMKSLDDDEEYAHIMSRMDELEKEELAAESALESEEDEDCATMMSRVEELEKLDLADNSLSECKDNGDKRANSGQFTNQSDIDHKQRISGDHQLSNQMNQPEDANRVSKGIPRKHIFEQDSSNQVNEPEELKVQSLSEDNSSTKEKSVLTKCSSGKTQVLPEVKENIRSEPQSKYMAFTGSSVEHTHNLEFNPREPTASSRSVTSQTTKPVSRFKMQRR